MSSSSWPERPKLWNRSVARKAIMGREPTFNPSPAAQSLLGRAVVRPKVYNQGQARKKLLRGKRHRRESATHNPVPAALSVLGGILKLPKFLKKPSDQRAAAVAPTLISSAVQGNLTAAKAMLERTQFGIAAERAVWQAAVAQLPPAIIQAVTKYKAQIPSVDQKGPETAAQTALERPFMLPSAAGSAAAVPTLGGIPTATLGQLAVPVVRELTKKPRGATRGRYPTYTDRYGRQRYSTKPPGTDLRIPAGATPSPGSPYSFFRGAVGKGGAAATVGQVAVAGAAGIAAYLVTQRVLQHLGGAAQRKEEAGVNAALAFRQARADFKQRTGRDPNKTELAEMKRAYQAQLVELGYDPVTFTRKRTGLENFLEDYNPLGG